MSTELHRDSCIDAEQLAAWADGGLSAAEAAIVETHLADCARCQTMMAAFAKTDVAIARPVVASAVLPWRRRGALRWALPLAAAASLVIWLMVPQQTGAPVPAMQSAKVEQQEQAFALPPPSAPVSAPPQASAQRKVSAAPANRPTLASPPPPSPSPAPPPPPVAEPPPAAPPPEPPRQTASSALERSLVSDAVTPVVVSEFPSLSELSAPAPAAAPRTATAGRAAGRGEAAAALLELPPVPWPRWRIFSDGKVERSVDAGATWAAAPIDPALGITSGAEPSPLVCWLVGRGGVVLVSSDTRTFTRADVPGAADLAAIRAVDRLRATVTATDGRVFSTTNGGASWRQTTP